MEKINLDDNLGDNFLSDVQSMAIDCQFVLKSDPPVAPKKAATEAVRDRPYCGGWYLAVPQALQLLTVREIERLRPH